MATALLFPGQGSQAVGMGTSLRASAAAAREVFDAADRALGFSISALCEHGPASELTLTANAQPAILTTSIATLRAHQAQGRLLRAGQDFHFVAGHSLGEWSALVAADVSDLPVAVRLVHLRGMYMQQAVAPGHGAMAAVLGLGTEAVAAICAQVSTDAVSDRVEVANQNGGGQVVISGGAAAVERAIAQLKAGGAKRAIKLDVSAPFHSSLMAPARDQLAQALADVPFRQASVPVVVNVSATAETAPARLKALIIEQVTAPVRWDECVLTLARLGVTTAHELGNGNVLTGLVKRITDAFAVTPIGEPTAPPANP